MLFGYKHLRSLLFSTRPQASSITGRAPRARDGRGLRRRCPRRVGVGGCSGCRGAGGGLGGTSRHGMPPCPGGVDESRAAVKTTPITILLKVDGYDLSLTGDCAHSTHWSVILSIAFVQSRRDHLVPATTGRGGGIWNRWPLCPGALPKLRHNPGAHRAESCSSTPGAWTMLTESGSTRSAPVVRRNDDSGGWSSMGRPSNAT